MSRRRLPEFRGGPFDGHRLMGKPGRGGVLFAVTDTGARHEYMRSTNGRYYAYVGPAPVDPRRRTR